MDILKEINYALPAGFKIVGKCKVSRDAGKTSCGGSVVQTANGDHVCGRCEIISDGIKKDQFQNDQEVRIGNWQDDQKILESEKRESKVKKK